MRDDAEEIAQRLEADMEGVLNRYYPGWIRQGNKALLTPKIKPKQKKATSSFTLNLHGQHRCQWYRFSQGVGGGMVALIYYAEFGRVPNAKSDWADAFRLCREYLGITQERQLSPAEQEERDRRRAQERADRDDRDRKAKEEQERREEARKMNAQQVWDSAKPLKDSHGEAYLMARGIPPVSEWPRDPHEAIRFHPSLDYELDRRAGRFPAVVGKVTDAFGDLVAVWQIYLDPNRPAKADLENPKVGRGPAAGGAVRIGGDGERIGAAEGMETAIALWVLEGYRKPIWAMLSTSGMRSFEPPMNVKHVSIYPDGDRGLRKDDNFLAPPGDSAANELFKRMKGIGLGSNINEMALLGDGLDLLMTRQKYERPERKEKHTSDAH